jgi:hypothetical protein
LWQELCGVSYLISVVETAASFSAAGTAFPHHSIARILFAGMGSGLFEFGQARVGPARVVRTREVHFDNGPRPIVFGSRSSFFEDSMMSSDDEDSFSGLINQMRRVHSRSVRAAAHNVPRFASPGALARSFAVNVGESSAGNAQNPLEIQDDSDDEVEVVEVVTSVE